MHKQIFLIVILSAVFCHAEEFKSYKDAFEAGEKLERSNRKDALAAYDAALALVTSPSEKIAVLAKKSNCQVRASRIRDGLRTLDAIPAVEGGTQEEKIAAQIQVVAAFADRWYNKDWETQIELVKKIQAMSGISPAQQAECVLIIAKAQEELDKYEEAIPSFEKVITMNQAPLAVKIEALNHIGNCSRIARNLPKALAAYEQISKIPDASPEIIANAWFQSGDTHLFPVKYNGKPSAADYAAAVKDYEKVLALEKLSPASRMQARLNIGNCAFEQGKYSESNKIYNDALAEPKAPANKLAEITNQLGESYVMQKEYGAAIKEFEKSLAFEKGVQDKFKIAALGRIGELYLEMADYNNALSAYERLKAFPKLDEELKKKTEQRIAIIEWRIKRGQSGK